MLSFEQAREKAIRNLLDFEKSSNIKLALLDDETMVFDYGWVFFYQSEEFIRIKNKSNLLGGNAPIIVDKYTGVATITGTARSIQHYIDEYCKTKNR